MGRNGDDEITARDDRPDDENAPTGLDQPVSEAEIDELVYNGLIPLRDRIDQLIRYRDELAADRTVDLGGGDTRALLAQIEQAISQLESDARITGGEAAFDSDPLEHRETLSPDDDDLLDLEALEDEEEQGDLRAIDGAQDD